MKNKIYDTLLALSREEYENTGTNSPSGAQGFYSRPGRFIIERRKISDITTGVPTEPICVRTHPMIAEFPLHSHDFIELMYVFSGSITHNISGELLTLSEGEIIILGRGTKHSVEPSGDTDLGVNLIIATETWEEILSGIRKSAYLDTSPFDDMLKHGECVYLKPRCKMTPEVSSVMDSLIYSALISKAPSYILKQSLILLLCHLIEGSSEGKSNDEKKQRLLDYVRGSYSTATLSEAAKLFGLSEAYLSRWISRAFGASFKELLMEERFAAACELLSRTDMPIGEIYVNIGYENSSYFHREFKSRYGMTPYEYRKRSFKS